MDFSVSLYFHDDNVEHEKDFIELFTLLSSRVRRNEGDNKDTLDTYFLRANEIRSSNHNYIAIYMKILTIITKYISY